MNTTNNFINKSHLDKVIPGKVCKNIENKNKILTYNSNCQSERITKNCNKNIKEIIINIHQKRNDSIGQNFNKKEICEKIIYIQKWWKLMNKIILIQKNIRKFIRRKKIINIIQIIKIIYKLFFKKLVTRINEKSYIGKKQSCLNEINNNLKRNILKKIKKHETSTKFNKRNILNNNSLLNNSNTDKHFLAPKLGDYKKTRNDTLKSFLTNNELSSLNTINNNKENTKYILLNKDNGVGNIKNKSKIYRIKVKSNITKNISNKEKLKAYNNIYNLYNNVKKIYENKNTNNSEINNSLKTNFNKKNNAFNFGNNKKKENNKIKNKKRKNEKIMINKNNNININHIQKAETENNYLRSNEPNHLRDIIKLKKIVKFWKEIIDKKQIIERLKKIVRKKYIQNDYLIIKNRIKRKGEKKETLSITTKKINLSNSVINPRLSSITPKRLNPELFNNNNVQKSLVINNYEEKRNNNLNKKYFSYDEDILNEKNNEINYKRRLYFYDLLKLFERKNNNRKIKECFNKWKLLNKINSKGIEEKIINFKSIKSPFNTSKNSALNIFSKRKNSIFQRNISQNLLCQTESNINNSGTHSRANSITFPKNIPTLYYFPQENINKDYIYKSNIIPQKIIYKKKSLIDKRNRKMCANIDEERNLTLNNSREFSVLNQTEGNFYKHREKNNKMNNSIYGGKFIEKRFGNFQKGYNRIEEREICFTPNKNSTFKNSFGINVNIIENYFNRGINRDERELYNNIDKLGIKTKQIIFNDKNKVI